MNQKPIPFVPRWSGAVQGHAINTTKRFYPRLAAYHEFDDLLQESYLVFLRCKRRYHGKPSSNYGAVDNPAWFMSLFSRALSNQFLKLISATPRYNLLEDYSDDSSLEPIGEVENSGYFAQMLSELPAEILELVRSAALSADQSVRRKAMRELKRLMQDGGLEGLPPRRIRLRTI